MISLLAVLAFQLKFIFHAGEVEQGKNNGPDQNQGGEKINA
jgi:hypothetical protein